MPTTSFGVHRVRGNGWVPFASAKIATRSLPAHIDLSGRRSCPGIATGVKIKLPPSFRPPRPPDVVLPWAVMLRHLRDYHAREGHTNVPLEYEFVEKDELGYEVDGRRIRLGVWLSKQWTEWQAKRLAHQRTERLADAGVDWDGPAPPASGLVGPKYLNERKWDVDREEHLATINPRLAFDASTPAHQKWIEYEAGRDPHTRRWRKEHGIVTTRPRSAGPHTRAPLTIEQCGSGPGAGVRARGVPPSLGLQLYEAARKLTAERAKSRQPGAVTIHP